MKFQNPLDVSSGKLFDQLIVLFDNKINLQSIDGAELSGNSKVLDKFIPRQMVSTNLSKMSTSIS